MFSLYILTLVFEVRFKFEVEEGNLAVEMGFEMVNIGLILGTRLAIPYVNTLAK